MSTTIWFARSGVLKAMNDSTLIRRENLRALKLSPAELQQKLGKTRQHWSNMLRGTTAFGETSARSIEEGLELPRGSLDEEKSATLNMGEGKHVHGQSDRSQNVSPTRRIPTVMPFTPTNLKSATLLMGSLLGALDYRSRSLIGELLKDLAIHPDEADDIAEKASVLATAQKPVTENPVLERAIRGRKGIAEHEEPHR